MNSAIEQWIQVGQLLTQIRRVRRPGEGKLILHEPLQNLVDLFDYGAHD